MAGIEMCIVVDNIYREGEVLLERAPKLPHPLEMRGTLRGRAVVEATAQPQYCSTHLPVRRPAGMWSCQTHSK